MAKMFDDQLMADLDLIESEIKRRKNSTPFEPYAVWAMNARIDAINKFNGRQLTLNHRNDSDDPPKKKPSVEG